MTVWQDVIGQIVDADRPGGLRQAMPALVGPHDAKPRRQMRQDRIPQPEIRPQRIGENDRRRIARPLVRDMQAHMAQIQNINHQ